MILGKKDDQMLVRVKNKRGVSKIIRVEREPIDAQRWYFKIYDAPYVFDARYDRVKDEVYVISKNSVFNPSNEETIYHQAIREFLKEKRLK